MPVCVKTAWMRHGLGHEAIIESCSAILRCLIMTEGRQCQEAPIIPARGEAGNGQSVWTELFFLVTFPGLFDHFITAWETRANNQACRITDFQGTSDPCCWLFYHALQTRACSAARWSSSSKNVSQARSHSLNYLPQWLVTWKWVFITAEPPIYVDRSTAGDHEVFEDTDRELQDVVRLGL